MSPDRADPAQAALVADRVAALSLAGLPLPRIWQVLAEQADDLSDLAAAVAGTTVGRSSALGLREVAPSDPALAWVALACRAGELGGAPLAGVLEAVATTLRVETEAERARQAAVAGPRATTAVLSWLPLAGFGLGLAVGVDALTVLVTTPPGWVCLLLGAGLWWAGRRWTAALLRRAERAGTAEPVPGWVATELDVPAEVSAEIVAALVDAGLPPAGAMQVLRRCVDELDLRSPPVPAELASVLQLSQRTGVAPSSLLRSAATERRRRRQAAAVTAAHRLTVLAVLPTGLCLLPAFVLLTVAPLVLALLREQLS